MKISSALFMSFFLGKVAANGERISQLRRRQLLHGQQTTFHVDHSEKISRRHLNAAYSTSADQPPVVVDGSLYTKSASTLSEGEPEDLFGDAVAVNSQGTCMVVGIVGSNSAKVYQRKDAEENWNPFANTITGTPGSMFGYAVDISADCTKVIVGAPMANDQAGEAVIFGLTDFVWTSYGESISGKSAGARLGWSVSLSTGGNVAAVGSPGLASNTGSVSVYDFDSSINQWKIKGAEIMGENEGDLAGFSLAISSDGQTVVYGSPGSGADYAGAGRVIARMFSYDTNAWEILGTALEGDGVGYGCGTAVDISADGRTVAFGLPGASVYNGIVRVFTYQESGWTQVGSDIFGKESGIGSQISLSEYGTIVAVYTGPISEAGYVTGGGVQLFEFKSPQWAQLGTTIVIESGFPKSPYALSLFKSGAYLVVASIGQNAVGEINTYTSAAAPSEEARVQTNSNPVSRGWTVLGDYIPGEVDASPKFISLSDNGKIVAAGFSGLNQGKVKVFGYYENEDVWIQLGETISEELYAFTAGQLNSKGTHIAVAMTKVPYANVAVRVYTFSSGQWIQVGDDVILDVVSNDASISLSDDGELFAVGVPTGTLGGSSYRINSDFPGTVRCFRMVEGSWTQISGIDGEQPGLQFGSDVSLSGNGDLIAVSALALTTGGSIGRVYKRFDTTWVQIVEDATFPHSSMGVGSIFISSDGQKLSMGSGLDSAYFELAGSSWASRGLVDEHGVMRISANGETAIVGHHFPYSNVGEVHVYDYKNGSWIERDSFMEGMDTHKVGEIIASNVDGSVVASFAGNDVCVWQAA